MHISIQNIFFLNNFAFQLCLALEKMLHKSSSLSYLLFYKNCIVAEQIFQTPNLFYIVRFKLLLLFLLSITNFVELLLFSWLSQSQKRYRSLKSSLMNSHNVQIPTIFHSKLCLQNYLWCPFPLFEKIFPISVKLTSNWICFFLFSYSPR